jgi:hypothetical protein
MGLDRRPDFPIRTARLRVRICSLARLPAAPGDGCDSTHSTLRFQIALCSQSVPDGGFRSSVAKPFPAEVDGDRIIWRWRVRCAAEASVAVLGLGSAHGAGGSAGRGHKGITLVDRTVVVISPRWPMSVMTARRSRPCRPIA